MTDGEAINPTGLLPLLLRALERASQAENSERFIRALLDVTRGELEAERAARRRREALLAWRAMHDPDLLVQDRLQTRWDFASGDDPEPILPGECDWLDGLPIAGPRGALP